MTSYANGNPPDQVRAQIPLSLDLNTFQATDFNVATIVSGLTDHLVAQSKLDGGAFDPSPFISTLETAVDHLIPLRRQVGDRTTELEKGVQAAERQYASKVKNLKDNYAAVTTGFHNLETRITEVGRTTVRVGDELETMDRLRTRASEARDIITYYYEFAKGDLTRIEALRKEGRDGRAKVAIIARRLAHVAKEIEDVEGGEATREAIDKYCERFETDMLKLFDRYYRKGDPKMMAHCAKVLLDFNGGQSCVQVYVNQHDFFISKDRIQDPAAIMDTNTWENLPDPDTVAPKSEPGLTQLYDEIRITVDQEAKIITAVFPHPPVVMQVFLQRVFAQVIQTYIERLIDTSSSSSTLAFLRVLYLARASTHSLVEDLKALDFFRSSSSGLSTASPSVEAASMSGVSVLSGSSMPATGANAAAVSLLLDLALAELFTPYIDKYVEKEQKNLTELYAGFLVKFTKWHRLNSKAKSQSGSSVFDRMVNQITTAARDAHVPSAVSSEGAKRMKHLMKLGGINYGTDKRRESSESLNQHSTAGNGPSQTASGGSGQDDGLRVTAEDARINLDVAERMLRWHAEAVGRMLELVPASEAPKDAFALLRVLGESFGQAYLETALDTAISQFAAWDGKSEPPVDNIRIIREIDLAVQLWQRYVSTAMLPLAGSSLATRREMTAFNSGNLTRIENRVNELVKRTTDAVTAWLGSLLSRQKRLDFKPKTDADLFEAERTEPCAASCNFILRVREIVVASVSGKNQEGILTDIGVTFHSLLLEHFKKFPVGDTGTILLTKDLAAYQDAMSTFAIPIVTERFEMLRQLGKLFEVQVDVLKSFLEAEHLARIDPRLLRPYIQLRSDYDKYPKRVFEQIFGVSIDSIMAPDPSGASREQPSTDPSNAAGSSQDAQWQKKKQSNSLWNQWMTGTGWFAPLIPPDPPEKLAEKQRLAEEQRRIEKMNSVHTWRPSQDDPVASTSASSTRPTLMKRLSSAVELKWWASDAPAPTEDAGEEDLQQQQRHEEPSTSSSASTRSRGNSLFGAGGRPRNDSLASQPVNEDDEAAIPMSKEDGMARLSS